MEVCPTCQKEIDSIKLLKCKFCEKNFCSLGCLVKHASTHLGSNDPSINIRNRLKRRQSENLTEQYNFLTGGDFKEKTNFDKQYDINNFSKVIEDIFPKQLGSGSFGRVFLVSHNETKKLFAQKVIEKRKLLMSYGKLDIIYNEINIHSKLDHENIIKLYNFNEDNENINIIMEYAPNGNLYDLITKEKNGFSEYKAFEYFIQVVNAVYYLHNNNIIHRDIKPENILIGEDNKIKLCDFGWAKELTLENRSTFCGTVEYMAPEIVGSENYDYGVDIWSLGILLYELLYGHSPFKANNTKNVILNIKSHELTYDDTNKTVSKSCKDLIQKILNNNPQKRYKIKDILEHPFVKKYQEKYVYSFKKNSSKNSNNEDDEDHIIKIKRANTKYISSINPQKMFFKFNSKMVTTPKHQNVPNTEKKENIKPHRLNYDDLSPKNLSSSKQIKLLQKFNDSLQSQFEKAKKSIENINFKNTESCFFEDFRDSQLINNNTNNNKNVDKESEEKIFDEKIKKLYKKQLSSKFTNALNFNKINKNINDDKIEKNNIILEKMSSESKKSQSNKNIIFENDLEDFVEDEEQKAAIDRLNRAYEKFGKENINDMN